jgi:hypothetical protein
MKRVLLIILLLSSILSGQAFKVNYSPSGMPVRLLMPDQTGTSYIGIEVMPFDNGYVKKWTVIDTLFAVVVQMDKVDGLKTLAVDTLSADSSNFGVMDSDSVLADVIFYAQDTDQGSIAAVKILPQLTGGISTVGTESMPFDQIHVEEAYIDSIFGSIAYTEIVFSSAEAVSSQLKALLPVLGEHSLIGTETMPFDEIHTVNLFATHVKSDSLEGALVGGSGGANGSVRYGGGEILASRS